MRPSKGKSLPFCAPVHNIMTLYDTLSVALSNHADFNTINESNAASSINLIRNVDPHLYQVSYSEYDRLINRLILEHVHK